MPSVRHESLVELFRNRPALAAELLEQGLQLALPAHDELRLNSAALSEVASVAYHADLVVELWSQGALVLGIVVEVQLRSDPDKRFTWPLYVASLRARLRCPCWLLVLSPDVAVAAWCAEPIELGHPGHTLSPLVLGPDAVPVIVNAARAQAAPELAVLSAMAHGTGHKGREVVLAALGAALGLDEERSRLYYDLVMGSLGDAARRRMEDFMSNGNYEYQTEFARRYVKQGEAKGKAEGKAEGEAKGVLVVLRARGLTVSPEVEERVKSCTDIAQLDEWLRRAVVVASAEEIFG